MDLMRVKLQNYLNAPVVNVKPNPFSISTSTENLITTRGTKCSKDFVANHITKSHGEDVYEVIEFADARNFLQCDECSFVARGKLPLKCHEENTHQSILKYSCSSCAVRHYDGHHVKEHQASNHESASCSFFEVEGVL